MIHYVLQALTLEGQPIEGYLFQIDDDLHIHFTTNMFTALSFTNQDQAEVLAGFLDEHNEHFYFRVLELEFDNLP